MAELEAEVSALSEVFDKLRRWINGFRAIATIVLKAHRAKKLRAESGLKPFDVPVVPQSVYDRVGIFLPKYNHFATKIYIK